MPMDREFGFRVTGSPVILASGHLDGGKDGLTSPAYDYQSMIATLAVRTDQPFQAVVPLTSKQDSPRIRLIQVRDAEMHVMLRGTVTGVSDTGTLQRFADANQVVRDDGPRLRSIGALAAAWYSKPRAELAVRWNQIKLGLKIGQMITDATQGVGQQSIGTPITRIDIDCQEQTTRIATAYYQIDAEGMAAFNRT